MAGEECLSYNLVVFAPKSFATRIKMCKLYHSWQYYWL